ncbi:hypothetical protein Q9Q94_01675 [Uliginosibacterium sp. 31-16]|uniref:hypothetical protein n=1 Tax=Uliginosibacterium sp. 31-16 TaxID=3068315 RepID=UPI00273FC8B9|nr:hypothetical protein [Uliginosibacterium sp. 31-16]MDP5238217.1 hypothetical protein [Uliginosibacterium sp. 31-16]
MISQRSLHFFALGILLVFHVLAAKATSTQSDLIGVWHSSLGKQRIVACWDSSGGIYYPLNKPVGVSFSASDETDRIWVENSSAQTPDGAGISWEFEKIANGRISGARKIQGKTEAIHLTRVQTTIKGKETQEDCRFPGSSTRLYDAFNAPRLNAAVIKSGGLATFMGKPYKAITALNGEVASVELLGGDSTVNTGNEALRKEFMNNIVLSFACRDDGSDRSYSQSKVRLRFWNADWLSWSSHGADYCGGPHPSFGFVTKTIDLHTGQEINLWNWLRLVKKQDRHPGQICEFLKNRCLPEKLGRLVRRAKGSYEDRSCKDGDFHDMVDGGYTIGINERGLAFIPDLAEPDRGMRPCYARYTIPFSDLQPYLTEAGLAAVGRILNL